MHRTYEATNMPIRVYWFNDRIEVISPGGAFGVVTAANFGQPGLTDYRNPQSGRSDEKPRLCATVWRRNTDSEKTAAGSGTARTRI